MRSAIYEGFVTHRRHATDATGNVAHRFRYPVTMPYLFLDELEEVTDLHPMWSARRPERRLVPPSGLSGRPEAHTRRRGA